MPASIPAGLTRDHVLQALTDLEVGIDHPFGQPTGYELVFNEQRYAPKAAIGLACRALLHRILLPEEFSGGEAPGQANFVLRQLGFTVVRKAETDAVDDQEQSRKDWTGAEVQVIVADYFAMLEKELLGKRYSKAAHRRALGDQLSERSKGSVEFKHQNISGVLVEFGLPYLEGYKPRGNYQGLLAQEVESYLERNPTFLEQLAAAPTLNPEHGPETEALNLETIIVAPPERLATPQEPQKPWLSRKGRRMDFAQQDALNRRLGKLGEAFVVAVERQRLLTVGRDDLAEKVEWVAVTVGDGLGYDVLSFDDGDDTRRLIAVKTTGLGKFFPFYVTANEVRCSEDLAERFQLFRVFDFGRAPRLYILPGSLRESCRLDPVQYRAVI